MKKTLLIFFALFLILSGCKGEGSRETPSPPSPPSPVKDETGMPAVAFLYRDMDGRPFRLSGKKGSPVILFFWRMKCPECLRSLKSLNALQARYRGNGLVVVAVGADTMHSAPIASVLELFKKEGYSFIAIRDSDGFVSEAYGVIRVPKAYVIDKEGVVAAVKAGETDWMSPGNTALIEKLLSIKR